MWPSLFVEHGTVSGCYWTKMVQLFIQNSVDQIIPSLDQLETICECFLTSNILNFIFRKCKSKSIDVMRSKSITIMIFVSLNLFVSNNINVPTISPNVCDRNNQNPNARPVFCVTHSLRKSVSIVPYLRGKFMYFCIPILVLTKLLFTHKQSYQPNACCCELLFRALKKQHLQSVNSS